MTVRHTFTALCALAVTYGAAGAAASAAGPPALKVTGGGSAQVFATGLIATPTAFAFGDGQVFYSDGTPPSAAPLGGVYVIKNGTPVHLAGSPAFSFGLAWRHGTLYVSAINKLLAWSGWNGTTFTTQKTIYTAPKGFPGFNGLAFGPDGRLYAGVDVGQTNDHGRATAATPYLYDILSFTPAGKNLRIVARGIRQPWQLVFPVGSSSPYVSDLGQDAPARIQRKVRDFVLRIRPGQNYGFPTCNWIKLSACSPFATPFKFFPSHSDVMGLGILGKRLYMSEFGGSTVPRVVSMPLGGGPVKVLATGFTGNIVGLGVHGGWVYVAQTASGPTQLGDVFRIKP
jgi:hypothetical protein